MNNIRVKNVALCVFLSIITIGIYQLYWIFCVADSIKNMEGREGSAVAEVICFIIPFYGLYWYYSRAKRMYKATENSGAPIDDNSVPCLLIAIFFFGVVSVAIMQSSLNQYVETTERQRRINMQ